MPIVCGVKEVPQFTMRPDTRIGILHLGKSHKEFWPEVNVTGDFDDKPPYFVGLLPLLKQLAIGEDRCGSWGWNNLLA